MAASLTGAGITALPFHAGLDANARARPHAFDAPGIARKRAIFPNDAMARNRNAEIVRRTRAGDRAHGVRRADTLRDLGIGNRFADGNLLQSLPRTLLERGSANVKGKIKADPRHLNKADNPRDQSFIVAIGPNEMRFRKAVLEIADEFVRVPLRAGLRSSGNA